MIKSNVTKDMIKYQISEKEKIFTIDSTYHVANSISDYWELDNTIWLETGLTSYQKAYIIITQYENGTINLRYTQKQWPENRFSNSLYNNLKKIKTKINITDNNYEINLKNNNKIIIEKNPFNLIVFNSNNEVILETNLRKGYEYLENFITPPLGFKQVENDIKKPFISFELKNDELIYGLGEKYKNLIKNGVETNIYNVDPSSTCNHNLAYGGVPFIVSNKNYGILLNSGHRTTFEIGSPVTDAYSMMTDEEHLELYLFIGNNMKEVISKYTELTGRITGVPDEAFGIWLNRLYYNNKEELFKEISNAKKNNYPLDVITLDPKWIKNRYTKTCNFEYNDEAFGDFKSLLKEVHSNNIKMCFWINPYFQVDNSETSKYVIENNFLVKSIKDNENYAHPWSGIDKHIEGAGLIDFTNPKAFSWYKDKIKYLLQNGVDFIKTDYGDGLPKEAVMYNGCKGEEFKQHYAYMYLKAAYEATQEYFGKDKGFVLSRPGFIGTQKFVGKWSGDAVQSFSELKLHLIAGLSLSLSGNVMWGTDIGGFQPYHKKEEDLYIRWTQLGMFTPFSRYHGIGPREPWYFGDKELEISKKYALIKKSLLPYYKKCEYEAIETGVPILRPLSLEFQDDMIASKIDDQYMLGDSIMVAPILNNKTYKRQIYLPEGQWIDFYDKKTKYEGNKTYTIDSPIETIPVFIKNNSIIPTIKDGNYKFNNLDNCELDINVFGKPNDLNINFRINSKKVEIVFQSGEAKVKSEIKTKIVKI
ncbi:alpha-D-xyloside xylohydrolase [Spiroplasma litorale]|uniref:Alpha-D-xyloside xylohydrolase n=1 Tax=Spiroplasma litorale TaxID=216942 RepID=A0A0K1W242_9MOLU|nr:TIM-barrel domain-containing protein [Spiroplasma litorale]AKX34243.1 alpha-D-xyloside xylohydrolase [Spiroplasma litorale]